MSPQKGDMAPDQFRDLRARHLSAVVVVFTAINPYMLVVIPVVIAIVVALARPSRDDAARAQCSNCQKQTTDHDSCSVFHFVALPISPSSCAYGYA